MVFLFLNKLSAHSVVKLLTAQNVYMQVLDRLTGVRTLVGHKAEAVLQAELVNHI